MRTLHYSYRIFWSEEDGEYVAVCEEIPGLSALASTEEEALREIKEVVAAWLDHLERENLPIPEPARHRRAAAAGG
jgi:predicted RNase H-like HicB family nuclease